MATKGIVHNNPFLVGELESVAKSYNTWQPIFTITLLSNLKLGVPYVPNTLLNLYNSVLYFTKVYIAASIYTLNKSLTLLSQLILKLKEISP